MGKDGNGTSATIKVIIFVLAVLGSGITIYSVFHAPLVQALTTETACRTAGDIEITKALTAAIQDKQKTDADTRVVLAEILTELKYIKQAVK